MHGRYRNGCNECSPYKCEACGLWIVSSKNADGKRLCWTCNPYSKATSVFDRDRKENRVNKHLAETLPEFTVYAIGTYAPFKACGDSKRPDTVLTRQDFMVIVETDEHGHGNGNYEISCEMAKALQHGQSALLTPGISRVAFIRFNPDAWKVAGETQRMTFKEKLADLSALIEKLFREQTTDEPFTLITLFYPAPSTADRVQKVTAEVLNDWMEMLLAG